MYFTLIFESQDLGPTHIIDLTFNWSDQPPDWIGYHAFNGEYIIQNRPQLAEPPSNYQRYVIGDFEQLLDAVIIDNYINVEGGERARRVGIVCHACGYGDEEDLKLLMSEVEHYGFLPEVIFRF